MADFDSIFSRLETKTSPDFDFRVDADGVCRWLSNNAPVPMDAAERYQIPVTPAIQQAALDRYYRESIAAYRKARRNYQPTDEELFEMRSAFGAGTEVVNVITGRRIKL